MCVCEDLTYLLSTGRYLAVRRVSVIRRRDQEWTKTIGFQENE